VSKRAKIIAAVVTLLVVAGVAAFVLIGSQGSGPEVETAQVEKRELAVTVTASGKIEAGVSADVFPPTAGTLDEIFVSDGETVTAGTKIAQMDTAPLEAQLAQAEAGLAQAEAGLSNVEQGGPSSADINAARAAVDAAYESYLAAKRQLAAVNQQAPSSAQIAAAEASTKAAKSAYDAAKAAYDAAVLASPNPSIDPTVTALGVQKDQAYAGYLQAKAAEQQLKSVDLTAARAQAQAGVDQAYAGWQQSKATLAKLQSTDTSAQREAARQAIASAAEGVALAQDALDRATLTAPIDGVVVFNSAGAALAAAGGGGGGGQATDGSAVSPQAAPFSVVDLTAVKFTAEVDEADIERVKVGQAAKVTLDAFPGEEISTTVLRINPAAQPTATGGTVFAVELEISDTELDVLIGMKGDAEIEVSSVGAAITIPVEALFSEGGTDYVYVVENNTLKKTEITVGATTDTEVEVLEGLDAGQVVALSGSTQYTDGMQVRTKQ